MTPPKAVPAEPTPAPAEAPPTDETPAPHVVEALRRVMRDLPGIGKDSHASPEQGGYAYRGIESITKHAQRLCAQHGVVFVPRVLSREVVPVRVGNKDWSDVRLDVEYTVFGPGGVDDKITVGPVFAIGRDGADKGANKCMTQAFKYALLQVFLIADSKDDADGTTVEADSEPDVEWMTDAQLASIREVVRELRRHGDETVSEKRDDGTYVLGVQILAVEDGRTVIACTRDAADDLLDSLAREAHVAEMEAVAKTLPLCHVCGVQGVVVDGDGALCDEHRPPPDESSVIES